MRACNRCNEIKSEADFPAKNISTYRKCRSKTASLWKAHHPIRARLFERKHHLARSYNLTIAQHEQIYADQGGRCAICGKFVRYTKMQTDHNHETGKIRGLLCRGCNMKLGWYEKLRAVIESYVK